MTKTFYACLWPYGRATDGNSGQPLRTVVRFPTKAKRDAWVACCLTDATTQPRYREALFRSDLTYAEGKSLAEDMGYIDDSCRLSQELEEYTQ